MKLLIKKLRSLITETLAFEINKYIERYDFKIDALTRINQKQLLMQMQTRNFKISDLGFSVFSESDEDGLLLYIFSIVGFKSKICVDIGGGGSLSGSNTANLIINHGFTGLIIEGDQANAEVLRTAYTSNKATKHFTPLIISEYVTVNNINDLIESNGIKGQIDLLSIDIDGIDYWIWDAITVVEPSVVIVEIQCILNKDESKTVPKDFKNTVFETVDNKRYGIYNSASLKAFTSLAERKGYSLVATSQLGFNAIFIKLGLLNESLPVISVEQGLDKPFVKWAQEKFAAKINKLEWIEV
jgi:hypothetical protein